MSEQTRIPPRPPPRNLPRPPQRVIPAGGIPKIPLGATRGTPPIRARVLPVRGAPKRGLPPPRSALPSPRARPTRNPSRPFPAHMQRRGGILPVGNVPAPPNRPSSTPKQRPQTNQDKGESSQPPEMVPSHGPTRASGSRRMTDSLILVTNYSGPDLVDVAVKGSSIAVKKALEAGAPIDKPDEYGNTALCVAATEGHYGVVEFLLEKGADPDVRGLDGKTPLHLAIYNDKKAIVTLFLETFNKREEFQYVNIPDDNGDTPLHSAIMLDKELYIEQLLRAGAEVSLQNSAGESAFLAGNKRQQNFITKICKQENFRIIKALPGYFESEKEKNQDIFEKIKEGMVDFVQEIASLDVTDKAGHSLLCVAVQAGQDEIVRLLIAKQANINVGCTKGTKASPLHYSIMSGDMGIVHTLLSGKADVNQVDTLGKTALHVAAEWKKTDIISLLLPKGADPSIADKAGRTPLHQAAAFGRAGIISMLLATKKVNVEQLDNDGLTALHLATMWNWDKAIRVLVTEGNANMEATNPNGLYPLHIAVQWKKPRAVRALLELNANLSVMNQDGFTPRLLAKKSNCQEIIDVFQEAVVEEVVAPVAEDPATMKKKAQKLKRSLLKASAKGDDTILDNLLETAVVPEEVLQSALFAAARAGHEEIIGKLLEHSEIDLSTCIDDDNGQTLLHAAVVGRNANIVQELISEDVSVNHQDHKQNTALHLAIAKRTTPLDIIRALCSGDADLGIQNQEGNTALQLLFEKALPEKIVLERLESLLYRMSVDQLNLQNNSGATALISAAAQYELCRKGASSLVDAGIDVNIVDNDGHSAIYWAVKRNHVQLCKQLVFRGAIIENQETLFAGAQKRLVNEILEAMEEMQQQAEAANKQADAGDGEIFNYVEAGDIEQVSQWLESGSVSVVDEYGSIPLHIASMAGHTDVVKMLLEANSDVNCADDNLQTPMHLAAMKGHASIVQLLLDFEGDPNVFDAEEQCPLDWATLLEHYSVVDILEPITS